VLGPGGRRADLLELEGDRGDVVAPPGPVGLRDEGTHGRIEAGRREKDLGDLLFPDHRCEAVGANQVDVPGARRDRAEVGLDLGVGTERPGDDRALRVLLGLLVGELSLAAQLLDQRMVLGQPLQLPVAQQIGAAVTDMSDRHLVALGSDDHRGERRSHAGVALVAGGVLVNLAVGRLEYLPQGVLGTGGELAVERLGGDPRGHLARLCAAHPVGDHEHRRSHVVGVLVGPALAAGVGAVCLLGDPQHRFSP